MPSFSLLTLLLIYCCSITFLSLDSFDKAMFACAQQAQKKYEDLRDFWMKKGERFLKENKGRLEVGPERSLQGCKEGKKMGFRKVEHHREILRSSQYFQVGLTDFLK